MNNKSKNQKFNFFVGVDISRDKLDFSILDEQRFLLHKELLNETEPVKTFLNDLKKVKGFRLRNTIFCMENTGFYGNQLISILSKLNANFVVENPLRIKNSFGLTRGKDDRMDSLRIAQYAKRHQTELKFWEPKRAVLLHLISLVTVRERLLTVSRGLMTPLKEQKKFTSLDIQDVATFSCSQSISALKLDLAAIDLTILKLINSDERLKRLKDIIISVPCVGIQTAILILIYTNEFIDIQNPKKFACYAGVAPFPKESGKMKGKSRVSPFANKKVKAVLHLCAMTSVRNDSEIKAYYERKTLKEGKAKMAVLNAIRNKIILRIFACLNQDRLYLKDFINPLKGHHVEIVSSDILQTSGPM